MKGVVLGCFLICLGLSLNGSAVTAQDSELLDLLSPTVRLLSPKSNTELVEVASEAGEPRNLIGKAKTILDIILVIPRKIFALIRRVITAVVAYWALVFRTIIRFFSGIISTIANTGGGIVNFFNEFLTILRGVVVWNDC